MRHLFIYSLAALFSVAMVDSSHAGVVFSDSFDRITGSGGPNGSPADPNNFSDWGTNNNAFGGANTAAYIVGPNRGGGANATTDGDLASTIEGLARTTYDAVADSPNGFSVAFDFGRFAPVSAGGMGGGFISMALGFDPTLNPFGSAANTANSQFAVLFQQGVGANVGNTQIFEDGAFLAGTASEGPLDYGDPLAEHSVLLSFTPATPGAYGATDVVNGSLSVDGGTPYNFSVLGGDDFGTVSFSSNGFVFRYIDDLVITATAVPEPTSVALMVCCALGLVAKRR